MTSRPVSASSSGSGTKGALTPRAAVTLLVIAMSVLASCRRNAIPTAADLPAIQAEAGGTKSASFFEDSPAREAVRDVLRTMIAVDKDFETELGRRFQKQELRSYLLLDESFIGGTFPSGIAKLLREVEQLETDHLAMIDGFPELLGRRLARTKLSEEDRTKLVEDVGLAFATSRRTTVAATEAHRRFVVATAELYELVAANPDALKAKRDGLETSDDGLLRRFNDKVDEVNAAQDAAVAAIAALDAQAKSSRRSIGLDRRAQTR